MGAWYLILSLSLILVLLGLSTHWLLIVIGAVLPFIPLLTILHQRVRQRRTVTDSEGARINQRR